MNKQLTVCQKMLKTLCINVFFQCCVKKLGSFMVYSLSFNLADLNWPKEQSTSIRYLWSGLNLDSHFQTRTFYIFSKASTQHEHPPPVPMCSDPDHSDFVSFEGECYFWMDQAKTWQEAEEECVKKNSHLVS